MRLSSLYGHVAELYDLFASSRLPADILVREFYRKRRYLGARDRRFISDVFYDSLRHYLRLEGMVRAALDLLHPGSPRIRMMGVGVCAAHALRVEGRSIEEVRTELAGLWRTVTTDVDPARFFAELSVVALPGMKSDRAEERLSWEYSLPLPLVQSILGLLGEAEGERLCLSLNAPPPVTLRVNTLRATVEECMAEFTRLGMTVRRTPLSPDGLILERRADLTGLGIFQRGWFELQDEGSQLLGRLVAPGRGTTLVDACAGGGGKSLHAAAMMENEGGILALDVEEGRLNNLRERGRRAGIGIIDARLVPEHGPFPSDWEGKGDAVLVDAPCSGTGTYRRNPGGKMRFAQTDIRAMSRLQISILDRAAALVRPGGRLVYSTCSLMREENEDVVEEFLASRTEFRILPAPALLRSQGIAVGGDEPMLHLLPHLHGTDAFFAVVMARLPV